MLARSLSGVTALDAASVAAAFIAIAIPEWRVRVR